ncbi:hypothetical protein ACFXI0_10090 [Kitasatospora indigofera]|uniref:hypothetical protein n=1 Tax=Kitasatospora indigofera TaxID=67307 RepID=UPI0036B40492
MFTDHLASTTLPGARWLAATAQPAAAERWLRERTGLLPVPIGERFDVLYLHEGWAAAALQILRINGRSVGPVLRSVREQRMGVLVPPGSAEHWTLPNSAVSTKADALTLTCPFPGTYDGPSSLLWSYLPDGSGDLTSTTDLNDALDAHFKALPDKVRPEEAPAGAPVRTRLLTYSPPILPPRESGRDAPR